MSLKPFPIVGLDKGYQTSVKPAMLPESAWQILENAYTFRERELKREGTALLGILERQGISVAGLNLNLNTGQSVNLVSGLSLGSTASIVPGSINIIGSTDGTTYTDPVANGVLVSTGGTGTGGSINYATGLLTITAGGGEAITGTIAYYPHLPVMGTIQREQASINSEQTIWFDTTFAYVFNGTTYQEFISGTTWSGSDSDFFWACNFRGALPTTRLLFVTNFKQTDPIRYTDGATWTDFAPIIADNPPSAAQSKMFQARILIPYWGRLIALNTYEGTTAAGAGSSLNYFNRCRFCQLGDPLQSDAWRSDVFGKGGFIDAPTSEAITGATFIKNTLVVDFEKTTWQLRYVGEYGLPFVWERISADFGSESTFSGVLFDNHRLAVGDVAITGANASGVDRIDLDIPNTVFDFKNANNGVKRVAGIRDYKRELVFWNYPNSNTNTDIVFPNQVLVHNYRNKTWAVFRDSVTSWGTFQSSTNITWDSLNVFWDSEDVTWDDSDTQSLFPIIVCGNQQGFVSCYGYPSPSNASAVPANDQPSLAIQAIDLTVSPIVITSVNHNMTSGEIIYISGLLFLNSSTGAPLATDLNDKIYRVHRLTADTFSISKWNFTLHEYENNFSFTPAPATALYVGGGLITLFPKLNIVSKDINLFQGQSHNTKLSYLDFLFEPVPNGAVAINLWLDATVDGSTPGVVSGNKLVGNKKLSLNLVPGFYPPGSQYAWFKFYATLSAQYFNINITYDDDLMNTLSTHQSPCTLYAINAWCRPGGRGIFGG